MSKMTQMEGLRFISAELENFKNIDKTLVEIGGESILVLGKNTAGKSSFIQALTSAVNSKLLPSEPIKKGQERAKISVKIGGQLHGEHKEYTIDIFFTPGNKSGRMVVTNDKGEGIKSPATFVKSLIGNVSFDVMKWLNESKEKKLNTIKSLTGCADQIDTLNSQIKEKKGSKKTKKDRAEELEAILINKQYTPVELEKYSEPVDMEPLLAELNQVSKNMTTYSEVENKIAVLNNEINNHTNSLTSSQGRIVSANNEIERLKAEIERQNTIISQENLSIEHQNTAIAEKNITIGKCNEWLSARPRPNAEAVNAKITEATEHNGHHNNIGVLAVHQKEMIKSKAEAEAFDAEVKALEKKRSDIISKSQLPIKGLSFTDEDILLDDVPLEEGQINTARLFEVGVDVAMAMNPNLKTIFLHDASLFDKANLKAIVKKIEERGYQAILEVVDYEGGELTVKFTEEELK